MDSYKLFIIARALHIFSIVVWIGGVSFVTLILIPALTQQTDVKKRFELFEALENRFAKLAKIMVVIAGVSGVYMLEFLHAWNRYLMVQYWWLHLMTFIWFAFAVVLFILEPWFLHDWFRQLAQYAPEKTFKRLKWMHYILLTISFLAVICGVCGSRGLF